MHFLVNLNLITSKEMANKFPSITTCVLGHIFLDKQEDSNCNSSDINHTCKIEWLLKANTVGPRQSLKICSFGRFSFANSISSLVLDYVFSEIDDKFLLELGRPPDFYIEIQMATI